MSSSASRLRTRLVAMALVAVVPALAITALTQFSERRRVRERAITDSLQLARLVEERSADVFEGAERVLETLARLPAARSNDPRACNDLVRDVLQDHPGYVAVGVTNADGLTFCLSTPIALQNSERAWFQRVVQTRAAALGGYQISRLTGNPDIVIAHPLLAPSGAVERVIVID